MYPIIAENISKKYKNGKNNITALEDVSVQVSKGELFGLIGPDGAGKTSFIRILTTLLLPDSGKAIVENLDTRKDYKKIRQLIGYMPGKFSLYQDLTVQENLHFFATLFHTTIAENYHLIKDIYRQIEPFKNRKAGQLSGGMKQKLALSCALIHQPSVLFLDEPTTGVDAVSRKEFWLMLQQLKQSGLTIFVSTPYMDEASLCDRVALIQHGRLLDIDTPQNIVDKHPKKLWALQAANMYDLLLHLRNMDTIEQAFSFGAYHHCTFRQDADAEAIQSTLMKTFPDITMHSITPGIEDVFMHLMQANHE